MTAPERSAESAQCRDHWGDMSCTLPPGHTGMHVDERVFGEVKTDADRIHDVRAVLANWEGAADRCRSRGNGVECPTCATRRQILDDFREALGLPPGQEADR